MGTLHKQDLEDILRHIAEAQRRVEDLRWRIASVEQAGADSSEARESLRLFEEALAHLIACREALLREKDQQR